MTLPPITQKQHDILTLLYRYRFLSRIQIQYLMNHKDYRRINAWLKDLREKRYIAWQYSTDFIEKTKPAIYYLDLNGIRVLKQQDAVGYPIAELRKRYKDAGRSPGFIARSLMLADCCLDLHARSDERVAYRFQTQADYADPNSTYHFLALDDAIHPHLCFTKREQSKPNGTKTYLLEIFDATLPRYRIRNRLKQYVQYLQSGVWEQQTEDRTPPSALFVCPTVADLIYAKRRTRTLLENSFDETEADLRFTTASELRAHGLAGEIWEEA